MDIFSLIDIVVLGCGVYSLYTVYAMKQTGEIKKGWLISNQIDVDTCKDKEGYINFISIRTIILGIIIIIYGGIGVINSYLFELPSSLIYGSMIVFFICLIWFAVSSSKANKVYFK